MKIKTIIFFIAVVVMFAGCAQPQEVKATYTARPVKVDGVLDEKVWEVAEVYPMALSKDRLADSTLKESGKVRVAWDEKWLYVSFDFVDSDIVAKGKEDGLHHYRFGDLAEVFVKPDNHPWYWELYVTPIEKKTTFFFPSRAHLGQPSCFDYKFPKDQLKVAAKVNGAANDDSGHDTNWTAEMAIPVSELTRRGEKFGPNAPWRIFVGRYNYSDQMVNKEHSMMPSLPKTDYHMTDHYGKLILEPKDSGAKVKK